VVLLKNFFDDTSGSPVSGPTPRRLFAPAIRFRAGPSGRRIAVSYLSHTHSHSVDTSIRRYVDTSIRRYVDTSRVFHGEQVQLLKQRGGVSAASLSRRIAGPTGRRIAVTHYKSSSLELFA
jgi:hypothetical protein